MFDAKQGPSALAMVDKDRSQIPTDVQRSSDAVHHRAMFDREQAPEASDVGQNSGPSYRLMSDDKMVINRGRDVRQDSGPLTGRSDKQETPDG